MALQPVAWEDWKRRARDFVRAHPTVSALSLTRGERLLRPGAREAFAVVTYHREAPVRALGGNRAAGAVAGQPSGARGAL